MNEDLIELEKGNISFRSRAYKSWSIFLDEIKIIGEYTNQNGPFLEDHFVVFITGNGSLYEAPTSCIGLDDALNTIGCHLGFNPTLKLTLETDFNSRISFPKQLFDHILWNFVDAKRFSLFDKLLARLGLLNIQMELSDEVRDYLKRNNLTTGQP